MIALIVTGVALVLMYLMCLRPMRARASGKASCCDTADDERLADMQRQVEALRSGVKGERAP